MQLSTLRKVALLFATVAIFVACATTVSWAQATKGAIVGTVLDSGGAAVPNAQVTATNDATGVAKSTKSNAQGEYRLENLPIGNYTISAKAEGFAVGAVKAVVELNKTLTVTIPLKVGAATEVVEVTGGAPAIDTTTAQLATTYDSRATADLPTANIGSGVLNLALLQAGVGGTGGIGAGEGPSVGGQRARNNNFTVEGIDNNNKTVTGHVINIPGDSVSNFTVITNQFTPEFGHSSGGQFNIAIQSGTNSFHGKAYEYMQNRNLNAVDYSLANAGITSNPRFDNNRFGGSIGGPIIKNKLFFFFNGEYNPVGQSAVPGSPVLTPTPAGFTTLSSIPGLSSTNLQVLKDHVPAAPTACSAAQGSTCPASGTVLVNGTPVQVGILPLASPNFLNNKAYLGSADWNISNKDTMSGRYVYNSSVGIDTSATLPEFFTDIPFTSHLFTLSEYHSFTPSVTNELRLGFNRFAQNFPVGNFSFPGLDAFPNLTFQDLNGLQVGPDPNAPQFTIQNTYQITDNVSWTKNNHTMKFGFQWIHYISPQSFTQRSRGDYNYNTLDAFLRDVAPEQLAERSGGNTTYYGDQNAFYWFVNDTWKLRQNLTLNIGLRHEFTTRPVGERRQKLNEISNAPDITYGSGTSFAQPLLFTEPQPPKTNFAPRVGIAWAPSGGSGWRKLLFGENSGDFALRAGFGMAYDVLFDNIGILEQPPQIGSTIDCAESDYSGGQPANCPPQNGFLANGGIAGGGSGITAIPNQLDARSATASWIPPKVKYPYSMTWNLGIERTFHKDYTFAMRYVGTRGVHLDSQSRINRIPKVTPSLFLPTFLTAPSQSELDSLPTTLTMINAQPSLLPEYAAAGFTSSVVAFVPNGGSVYHGLDVQLNRRFSSGLFVQTAYTWSHTIDDSTADFFSTFVTPRRPQDFQNLRAERSNSGLDRNQRFTLALVYDVPWFSHANWFMKNLVGNWEVAPVFTAETGEWADVQSARDVNRNGDGAGDRVVVNPSGDRSLGSGVTTLKNSSGAVVGYLATNPKAYYIRGGLGALANSSRNTLQLPGIGNLDLTLLKRFSFTERYRFEFGAQMLNALNHPQFIPGTLNDIRSFGQAGPAVLDMLTPDTPTFNEPNKVFPSNARTVQLSAKFIF